jgi:uracil-DNA glycosylase
VNALIEGIFADYKSQPAFAEAMGDKLVLGEGVIPARVAIVGEAPDAMAERAGHPFFGPSFQMLTQFCMVANVPASCWFTNVVKLKPVDPEDGKYRPPTTEEIYYSLPYLDLELTAAGTREIIALGKNAAEALTGRRISMKAHHGLFFDGERGRTIFVTYHPAVAMFRGPEKQELREDIAHFAREIS